MDCSPPGSSVDGILEATYWSGLSLSPPGDLPGPGIEPMSPALAGKFFTTKPPRKPNEEHTFGSMGFQSPGQNSYPSLIRAGGEVDGLEIEGLGQTVGARD